MRQGRGGRGLLSLRHRSIRHFAQLLIALCGLLGQAAGWCTPTTWRAQVVGVTDGDTLVVLDAQRHTHKIRLAAIDAPEKAQAHAQKAREALARRVHGQQVVLHHDHKDRYGRLVAQVWLNDTDVGLSLLQAGWAWHYLAYAPEQSARDRRLYAAAEADARRARRGLWTSPNPIAPWTFRAAQRHPAHATDHP